MLAIDSPFSLKNVTVTKTLDPKKTLKFNDLPNRVLKEFSKLFADFSY